MATIDITTQEQRDKLEQRLPVIERVAQHEKDRVFETKRATMHTNDAAVALALRDALDAKMRIGAVADYPALGGQLEPAPEVWAVERDEGGDIVKLHTHDDARAFLGPNYQLP